MAVNRGAAYLAGTSRSVGKGWPSGHLLPDQDGEDKLYSLYSQRCERFLKYGAPANWKGITILDSK